MKTSLINVLLSYGMFLSSRENPMSGFLLCLPKKGYLISTILPRMMKLEPLCIVSGFRFQIHTRTVLQMGSDLKI
jgi:hypothetical protein